MANTRRVRRPVTPSTPTFDDIISSKLDQLIKTYANPEYYSNEESMEWIVGLVDYLDGLCLTSTTKKDLKAKLEQSCGRHASKLADRLEIVVKSNSHRPSSMRLYEALRYISEKRFKDLDNWLVAQYAEGLDNM